MHFGQEKNCGFEGNSKIFEREFRFTEKQFEFRSENIK